VNDNIARRIVISGASNGIGRAIAQRLSHIDSVIINLDICDGDETASRCQGRFHTVNVDVGARGAVTDAFDLVDQLLEGHAPDLLVCCAALSRAAPLLEVQPDDLDRMMDINVKGTFSCCQEAARRMIDANRGHIVIITSICAVQGWAGESVYCVTKGAQQSLVQALSVELAPFNILVNAVAPGIIEQTGESMAKTWFDPEVERHDLERTALQRFGTPAEVADAVYYLSTVTWMTGQTIFLDGGFMASGLSYFGNAKARLRRSMPGEKENQERQQ